MDPHEEWYYFSGALRQIWDEGRMDELQELVEEEEELRSVG